MMCGNKFQEIESMNLCMMKDNIDCPFLQYHATLPNTASNILHDFFFKELLLVQGMFFFPILFYQFDSVR